MQKENIPDKYFRHLFLCLMYKLSKTSGIKLVPLNLNPNFKRSSQ